MDGRQVLEEIKRTLSETGHLQDTQEEQEETSSPEEAEAQPSPHEREPYELPGATIIHVYVVDGPPVPLEEDARTVESTLESATFGEGETPQPITHPLLSQSGQLRVALLLLAVCLFMSAVVTGTPLLHAEAQSGTTHCYDGYRSPTGASRPWDDHVVQCPDRRADRPSRNPAGGR